MEKSETVPLLLERLRMELWTRHLKYNPQEKKKKEKSIQYMIICKYLEDNKEMSSR